MCPSVTSALDKVRDTSPHAGDSTHYEDFRNQEE